MIIEEIKNIKSTRSDLRKFGITMSFVLGLLAGLFLWRGKDYYLYFLILALLFLLLGLALPDLLKIIYKIWMSLAMIIGWFMTGVILIVFFYLVFTPIGLFVKLFGKRLLGMKLDRNAQSYWVPRKTLEYEKRNYEAQF